MRRAGVQKCARTGINLTEPHLNPAEIVERIRLGDISAESEFVERYWRSLYLLLLKRTNGDKFVARECRQETLLIALTKMRSGKIREPESIAAFLRQTAIYTSVSYYRKQSRYVTLDEENFCASPSYDDNVISNINSEQLNSVLREVLDMLPMSRDRKILAKFFLQEQDKKNICEDMGLSPEHFDRVLYRAKKRVREILRKNKPLEKFLNAENF